MTSRRRVLLSSIAAAFGAACSSWAGALRFLNSDRECKPYPDRLLTAAGIREIDLSSLLKHAPARDQLARVLSESRVRLQRLRGVEADTELRATLRRWIAEDFENGALTEIDGWQLSSAEAMLLALRAQMLERPSR